MIDHLPNGRDVGGMVCADGAVLRRGLLFRGAAPSDEAAAAALAALGVRANVDLRTVQEREFMPVSLPAGTAEVVADVLADASYSGAASLGRLAAEALGRHDVAGGLREHNLRDIMISSYRDFVVLPSARSSIASVIRLLARPDTGPVFVHCTAGKDRTGWLIAVVLQILGARFADIEADYLASGPAVLEMFSAHLQAAPDPAATRELLAPVLGVFPEYLAAAVDEVGVVYGTFEDYVHGGLGIDDETVGALRARLLQPSSASALA